MDSDLYSTHFQPLLAFCRSIADSEADGEDLAQETMLRALTRQGAFSALHPAQQRAWLYQTARNLWIDTIRRRRREELVAELPELPFPPREYGEAEWRQVLSSLPGEEGLLLTLRYWNGLSSTEIGKLLKLQPGTVRARLSTARAHLRALLNT